MTETPTPPQPAGSLSHRISDRIFRGMLAGMRRLPYDRRIALMGQVVARAIGPLAGYHRRSLDHLAQAFPDLPAQDRATIARRALNNTGRTIMELYSGADFTDHVASLPITGPGLDAIHDARGTGRGVVFVTGHFGNHEAARHALVARGFDIGGLYRPMKNPYFNDHYARTMTSVSGPVFAQGRKGTIGFIRHIAQGGMATLLFDVWAGEGCEISFMGRPAATALSAADIALRNDALLVPYFATRRADGLSFDIEIEAPIPASDALTMMQEATKRLEQRIHAHPDQYFWPHRRWKPLAD